MGGEIKEKAGKGVLRGVAPAPGAPLRRGPQQSLQTRAVSGAGPRVLGLLARRLDAHAEPRDLPGDQRCAERRAMAAGVGLLVHVHPRAPRRLRVDRLAFLQHRENGVVRRDVGPHGAVLEDVLRQEKRALAVGAQGLVEQKAAQGERPPTESWRRA